jgi:hypothetical protein
MRSDCSTIPEPQEDFLLPNYSSKCTEHQLVNNQKDIFFFSFHLPNWHDNDEIIWNKYIALDQCSAIWTVCSDLGRVATQPLLDSAPQHLANRQYSPMVQHSVMGAPIGIFQSGSPDGRTRHQFFCHNRIE